MQLFSAEAPGSGISGDKMHPGLVQRQKDSGLFMLG